RGPKFSCNHEWGRNMGALDGQLDRITRLVLGPGVGDGILRFDVASIDLDDSISRSQSGGLRGAATSDTINKFAMLGLKVLIIKTQFHRNWPVVAVHPKNAVKDGGCG